MQVSWIPDQKSNLRLNETIVSAAIRTHGATRFFNRQVHTRMRVPQIHARHWAGQWQISLCDRIVVFGIRLH